MIKHSREYRLTTDAIESLVGSRSLRDRLLSLDYEVFSAPPGIELPAELAKNYAQVNKILTSKAHKSTEGQIKANLEQLHHNQLNKIAELLLTRHLLFVELAIADAAPRLSD